MGGAGVREGGGGSGDGEAFRLAPDVGKVTRYDLYNKQYTRYCFSELRAASSIM